MRKLIVAVVVCLFLVCMCTPAFAATPTLAVPDVPQIPKLKLDIKFEIPDSFWANWFKNNPITLPTP